MTYKQKGGCYVTLGLLMIAFWLSSGLLADFGMSCTSFACFALGSVMVIAMLAVSEVEVANGVVKGEADGC